MHLSERYANAALPSMHLIDRTHQKNPKDPYISDALLDEMGVNLTRGEQTLLFLNRRGYAPIILCHGCGYRAVCPACSVHLVWHKRSQNLQCHYCGFHQPMSFMCPTCFEPTLRPFGMGAEKLFEHVTLHFPHAKVVLMTSDWQQNAAHVQDAVSTIESGDVDIIIGTQMMAKGYHFPKLTLVGILDADMGLLGVDYRAGERTYQLIQQVSGRAGRETLKGRVFLQTFQPHHPILKAIIEGDRHAFEEAEREMRQAANAPPFSRMALITVCGLHEETVMRAAAHLADISRKITPPVGVSVIGPSVALISKINARYQWQFLIKGPKNCSLGWYIKTWLSHTTPPKTVRIKVNIDP